MKVTIIGAGNMGRGIGSLVVAGGNDLELVDRNPDKARGLADELTAKARNGGAATAAEPDGRIGGDVVILAVYYPSLAGAIEQYREQLRGKVVVEISVPLDWETRERLLTPPDSSAAEEAARLVPEGTPVVKAFNTTFAGTLAAGEVGGQPLDVLIAGDDDGAKRSVTEIVEAGGQRAIDVGPLRRARQLEQLAWLHVAVQEPLGSGFGSAVKFLA